ncbi:uncharacterized protein LOC130622965 [Hydractinia symbiolongicarpus]|uniref:uncharacterized protein LOC130622965 n=1 Tax=Hydractinia symbiolongicarpus TaxID=13093 RepID=UPI00254F191A|nr:uncharacterized protein LOC130622965 [Hydractinia symbiolongicarpus]
MFYTTKMDKEDQHEIELEVKDFQELFNDILVDPASVILTEDDISDPHVKIDIEKLPKYKVEHLKSWLIFRGDTLHGIDTLKDAQVRVLHYIESKTSSRIVDPTPEKVWLRIKAEKMGILLKPLWKEGTMPAVPVELKADTVDARYLELPRDRKKSSR